MIEIKRRQAQIINLTYESWRIYENALAEGEWYMRLTGDVNTHKCMTCEHGLPLMENDYRTTGDEHDCENAYGDVFETQDNGGGYWVTACSSYKRAKIDYHKYLRTKRWREKANARLKMDGYQCVLCKSAKNLAVHHITYENIGYEQMDDLISVCKGCHEKLHEHDSIRPEKRAEEKDRVKHGMER